MCILGVVGPEIFILFLSICFQNFQQCGHIRITEFCFLFLLLKPQWVGNSAVSEARMSKMHKAFAYSFCCRQKPPEFRPFWNKAFKSTTAIPVSPFPLGQSLEKEGSNLSSATSCYQSLWTSYFPALEPWFPPL